MDFVTAKEKLMESTKKYRGVFIVILAGILLMALPQPEKKTEAPVIETTQPDFQQTLEEVLCAIQGAGDVRLFLSQESGAQTFYQSDEDRDGPAGGIRRETVIVTGENREERGLVLKTTAPRYRGAVVIAQGGDRPSVILDLKRAVSSATGLAADKITVFKMK